MIRWRTILLLLVALALTACATFRPTTPNYQAKGKTMAIISGLENGANLQLAHYMTVSMAEFSKFQMVPQKKIAELVRDYPFDIHGPYKAAYFDIEEDYSRTDVEKIRNIQKKLGVDYLYVLWAPSSTTYNARSNVINCVAQLFEFPGGKEVGRGRFGSAANGKIHFIIQSKVNEEDIDQGMLRSTRHVSRELAQKIGMAK
jgi:hypothetical protein